MNIALVVNTWAFVGEKKKRGRSTEQREKCEGKKRQPHLHSSAKKRYNIRTEA